MIRALFLDVDGTLVSFSSHRIPDSAREALMEAHRRGIRIFIATGRTFSNLAPVAGIPYDGVVALNGAACYTADGEPVDRHPIPYEVFDRALHIAAEEGFPVLLELEDGLFADRIDPAVEGLMEMVNLPHPTVTDLRRKFAETVCCQLCFFFDAETERRVMPRLPELVAARWYPTFADINLRGCDKATGMRSFMERFGLRREEVAAFGDGGNDVPMLRAAGVGVAMGNACDEAREAADRTTASVDDDGLARALRELGVIGAQ